MWIYKGKFNEKRIWSETSVSRAAAVVLHSFPAVGRISGRANHIPAAPAGLPTRVSTTETTGMAEYAASKRWLYDRIVEI